MGASPQAERRPLTGSLVFAGIGRATNRSRGRRLRRDAHRPGGRRPRGGNVRRFRRQRVRGWSSFSGEHAPPQLTRRPTVPAFLSRRPRRDRGTHHDRSGRGPVVFLGGIRLLNSPPRLERPLSALALESTAALHESSSRYNQGVFRCQAGAVVRTTALVNPNPGIPIPAARAAGPRIATPTWPAGPASPPTRGDRLATSFRFLLKGADLTGFNLVGYDLPILVADSPGRLQFPARTAARW